MSSDLIAICIFLSIVGASAKSISNDQPRTVDALSGGDILERNLLSRALSKVLSSRTVDSLDGDILLRGLPADRSDQVGDLLYYLNRLRELDGDRLINLSPEERNLDTLNGMSFTGHQKKRLDTLNGMSFGTQKRNFDEIDKAGFGGFMKRNFDEIDKAGFGGFFKRSGNSRAKSQ